MMMRFTRSCPPPKMNAPSLPSSCTHIQRRQHPELGGQAIRLHFEGGVCQGGVVRHVVLGGPEAG